MGLRKNNLKYKIKIEEIKEVLMSCIKVILIRIGKYKKIYQKNGEVRKNGWEDACPIFYFSFYALSIQVF